MGLNRETRQIYFAFPSKLAEPAKLLVLIININTLQVTFKNQEDIQNCLRRCWSRAEMVNLELVCRKPFLDTFHCQLHAITNYSSAWDVVTSSHTLQYSEQILQTLLGKMPVWKTSICSPMFDERMQVLHVFQLDKLFFMDLSSSLCWSTDHNSDLAGWFSKSYIDLIVRAVAGKNPK